MANITPTSAANFIPEVWANVALNALRANIVLAPRVRRDSSVASFAVGDVLNIPVPGTFVANNKVPNSAVTPQVPTDANVQVVLNQHKEVTFVLEDITSAFAQPQTMFAYLRNATAPLAESIELALFAEAANFTESVGAAGTDLDAADLRTILQAMNDNRMPLTDRFLIVSPKDQVSLLADTNLAAYFANADPQSIREGNLGRIFGMDVLMSQLVPFTPGTPNTTRSIAGSTDALILAMRGLPTSGDGRQGVSQINITDPESGLTLRQTVSYDTDMLGVKVTLDVLFGVEILRDAAGIEVLS